MKSVLLPLHLLIIRKYVIKHKIQVIHAHQRLPILIGCITGIVTGVPVIATVHGRTRFDLRSRISRKYTSRIIFVSRHVLEVSAKFEEIKEKSVIIPNWVSAPAKINEIIPYSISYVSRVDRKHSDLILLIIKEVLYPLALKYPEISLRIIGEGDYLEIIRTEAEALNKKMKREVCVICGFVLDVKEILGQSDLVIGVGRVALEAMASGVPVLSMNRQRMGSIISTTNYSAYKLTNFVAPGSSPPDENSMLNILNDFFSNPELRKNEAFDLKKLVTGDYDPVKITEEIMKIYRSVIGLTDN
jgi:glycosyltransferase involved in cell wall biosynthesis